jgi:Zn-dependent membrane protease YugP
MWFWNPLYFLFTLPALILGLIAQAMVKSAFNKYSQVRTLRGLTGAQAAASILRTFGLFDVTVEETQGMLSDHYDPRSRTLRLSPDVYRNSSIAAVGVAAHESGHALQHAKGYWPLQIRTQMVPTVQLGSWLGPIIFMVGFFLGGRVEGSLGYYVAVFGLILFAVVALFAVVTLPVELDASRRAKQILVTENILDRSEMDGVNRMLNAAALTYVAAAVQAILTLLYYAFILFGNRRRN